jgi:hypothetical protein
MPGTEGHILVTRSITNESNNKYKHSDNVLIICTKLQNLLTEQKYELHLSLPLPLQRTDFFQLHVQRTEFFINILNFAHK